MLGERIFILRCQKGLTQAELARMLNNSTSALGMYEQGRRQPALNTIVHSVHIFDVSADYLLVGKQTTKKDIDSCVSALRYLCDKFRTDVLTLFADNLSAKEVAMFVAILLSSEVADF